MEEKLKIYEKTITKKHSFNWTPNYKEGVRTSLNKTVFIPIAEKTFQKLDWDVVYKDDNKIEAKRREKSLGIEKWTEIITVTYNFGTLEVKSESLGNEMWDNGRNSKRVKLFIHALKETENEFDRNALNELEKETEKKNNWDDYIIPDTLPKPAESKKPSFLIPVIGGIITSLILGFLIAKVSIQGIYIIGLFEFLVGIAIAFALKFLIKASNFTDLKKLHFLLIAMIIITYLSNQYFQYEIILRENNYDRIGFFEFMKIRFSQGLTIKTLNTGWIGLVISWILQLGLTYAIAYLRLVSTLTSYQLERIPTEVLDFSYYHFLKGKSDEEVRMELANKGWVKTENQDEVFEAIHAIYGQMELSRIK